MGKPIPNEDLLQANANRRVTGICEVARGRRQWLMVKKGGFEIFRWKLLEFINIESVRLCKDFASFHFYIGSNPLLLLPLCLVELKAAIL